MRRNNRRVFNNKNQSESKKLMMISISVLIIAITAFVVTFMIYSSYLDNSLDMAEFEGYSITELGKTNNQISSEASSSIGKTVNEVEEELDKENSSVNAEKIAINTSAMEKEDTNKVEGNNISSTQVISQEEKKEEKVEDPTFIKPVDGEITTHFATDTLIYSNTLQEWVTHNGIDIKADKASVVKASAEGTVKSIKNDPRYGITVVIEHVNGYCSVYANLLTAEFVKEEEQVKQGQTIGTVGNTATFEIADDSHLHFEILKDNEYLDPNLYIK